MGQSKHTRIRQFTSLFVLATCLVAVLRTDAFGQGDLWVWNEFVETLKGGDMTADRIRPYDELGESFKPVLLGYLDSLHAQASSQDWGVRPEALRTGNRIQYIFPWTWHGETGSYCFSFIVEDSSWYFQHLEAIAIRLDRIPSPPVSQFPDIAEDQKSWIREELYWSFIVTNVYLPVAREKGTQAALNMLKDGPGYYIAAKSWVPFAAPHKSFVLYLCWEQANLRGNQVTLEKLDDTSAVVRLSTYFIQLYFTAAHLKPVISFDDYRAIFETIWQDRAASAGWNLSIEYDQNYEVTFRLSRWLK